MAGAAQGAYAVRPYSVEHYQVSLDLDFSAHVIKGTEKLRIKAGDRPVSELELDADELRIKWVKLRSRTQRFSVEPGVVRIGLEHPIQAGRSVDLAVSYSATSSKGLYFFSDQAYTVYSTSRWMVVNHRNDDLATLDLSITSPANMTVVANGENVRTRKSGATVTSNWRETRRIPDFVFGFAAGIFERSGSGLSYLGGVHSAEQMQQIFKDTENAMEFFTRKSGVKYPSKVYSQVLAHGQPEQELGDFTLLPESYGDSLLKDPTDEWLMAHELAHQWWGIGVTCREWSDFWLNEGMATFMADVYLGERFGAARYDREIEAAHGIYEQLKRDGKDHALSFKSWRIEKDVGGRLPYNKGAWVLHLLKQELGEDVFWRGIAEYTRSNWGRSVSSKDLQFAMEHACGRDLSEFFNQWIYN